MLQIYDAEFNRLRSQIVTSNNNLNLKSQNATIEKWEFLRSQNAIPSKQHLGGSLPFVFTEQGVATISAVLTSERAIEVNIQIMRAFVAMRRFIASNAKVFQRLDTLEIKHGIGENPEVLGYGM
jgi:hypothetical protein